MLRILIASLILLGASSASQSTASQDDEIVVTGVLPKIQSGLWKFQKYPIINFSAYSGRGRGPLPNPGRKFDICVPDAAFQEVIKILLIAEDGDTGGRSCRARSIKFDGSIVSGRLDCTSNKFRIDKRFRGILDQQSLDVRIQDTTSGIARQSYTFHTRLKGSRVGECVI